MNFRLERKETASDTLKNDATKQGKQKDARGCKVVDMKANDNLNEAQPLFRAMEMQQMTQVQFQHELTPSKSDVYSYRCNTKQSHGKSVSIVFSFSRVFSIINKQQSSFARSS